MVSVHSGELAAIRVRATDPVAGSNLRDVRTEAHLYAPGRSPQTDAAVRAEPDLVIPLTWDEPARSYVGNVSTAGLETGTWSVAAEVSGGAGGHQGLGFSSLEILP